MSRSVPSRRSLETSVAGNGLSTEPATPSRPLRRQRRWQQRRGLDFCDLENASRGRVDKVHVADGDGGYGLVPTGDGSDEGRCVRVVPDVHLSKRKPSPVQSASKRGAERAPGAPVDRDLSTVGGGMGELWVRVRHTTVNPPSPLADSRETAPQLAARPPAFQICTLRRGRPSGCPMINTML